jgi:hypothetical protein
MRRDVEERECWRECAMKGRREGALERVASGGCSHMHAARMIRGREREG